MTVAASEIVLVDVNQKLAQAKAEGILHAVSYPQPARVSAGYCEQLEGAGVALICCGVVQRPLSAVTASFERRPSHRRTRRRDSAMGFRSQLMMTFEARNLSLARH